MNGNRHSHGPPGENCTKTEQLQRRAQRWWRHPLVGYLMAFPLVALALIVPTIEALWHINNYFIGSLCFIATAIVGLLWGVGPALFTIILSVLALDFFIIPPIYVLSFYRPTNFISLLPFIIAQLFILFLIVLRERDHQRIQAAEQKARDRAHELAINNQALQESNTKLERMDQLKDLFISQASHELKTPITTIRGQVQIALRRLSTQQTLPEPLMPLPAQLEKVEAQTIRLHALVDDLLDLSSFQSKQIPLRIALCDLNRLCQNVVEDQEALSGYRIEMELPPSPLLLQADCERLSQVLTNLLTNAIKYSPSEASIRLCLKQEQARVLLGVHNSGSRIPEELQEHIFEPFYRAPGAQASSKKGWGLGLAISKEIVERHGGKLWVESSEEEGTTFFVSLPTPSSATETVG
ncbi:sensor histidine kinase [Dictyobacter aurantiacus]|uniref:histidine kinase n=1 Tax=Dictyobacter aurantiacus TaxID=1936993 RepID=A0A401ZJZ6_9CHLR|nr:HAMP domain-containing sensor histidine kinase [Dictyobacter aurantiacus]GCE07176.1 hypothetical protein KDAU_45050 [Dictyobacter aurantiacus]